MDKISILSLIWIRFPLILIHFTVATSRIPSSRILFPGPVSLDGNDLAGFSEIEFDPQNPIISVDPIFGLPDIPAVVDARDVVKQLHHVNGDSGPGTGTKLSLLRKYMAEAGVDAYTVPSNDEHQNEYVSGADKRRAFISGFLGSAGVALITATDAVLWTDGRYHLQASQELDPRHWTLMRSGVPGVPKLTKWIQDNLPKGAKIGMFANIISYKTWKSLYDTLGTNYSIVLLPNDLVDAVWNIQEPNRPIRPENPISPHPLQFSGESWRDKIVRLREKLSIAVGPKVPYSYLVTGLDEIAWLFNLRGTDIPYNPVFYAYAVVSDQKMNLFVNPGKLDKRVYHHLEAHCQEGNTFCIKVLPYDATYTFFAPAAAAANETESRKIILSQGVNMRIYASMNKSMVTFLQKSPIRWMKVVKNAVEIEGMKRAQYRDSVALIDFASFLEQEIEAGNEWDELTVLPILDNLRGRQQFFQGLSFESISAFGPNSAVIHYGPSNRTKRKISTESVYLLDSGGQYLDGTTDVTRTFHFGNPTQFQKEAYTRVLMGVINLASLIFPTFVSGRQIDVVARQPLWSLGLDFRHGTGHGIGSFLNVHEDPIYIGIFGHKDVPFSHGMFVSDEPGYYLDNEFGIRLETIVMVKNATTRFNTSGNTYLTFEAATLVPFEPNLILYNELTCDQLAWLISYNAQIEAIIKPAIVEQELWRALKWLDSRILPLDKFLVTKGCPG